jgi:hypothetical protein
VRVVIQRTVRLPALFTVPLASRVCCVTWPAPAFTGCRVLPPGGRARVRAGCSVGLAAVLVTAVAALAPVAGGRRGCGDGDSAASRHLAGGLHRDGSTWLRCGQSPS